MNKLKTNIVLLAAATAFARANAGVSSNCAFKSADSTCTTRVDRATVSLPPPKDIIYDGPISGAPISGSAYWGFDFASASGGAPSPIPRDMFVNRSASAVSLLFTFDLPREDCGDGCRPGMEFKLNASWDSFFPNIVVANGQAIATLQVAPGQAYGFVIALWQSKNPRLKVQNLGSETLSLADVGLSLLSIATPIPGSYFSCECGDGVEKTCYSGTRYSNGLMGQWYRDRYIPWDAFGCN